MTKRRVAVTGQGVISPLGNTPDAFFLALMAGKSGIGRLRAEFADQLECRIAAQTEFDPQTHFNKRQVNSLDRVSQFALVAARQAVAAAGLDPARLDLARTGVTLGTGMGGANSLDEAYARLYRDNVSRLNPFIVLMAMNGAAASNIALEYQLAGPNYTYSTACSSSAVAIGEAYRLIRHGYADTMLAGGSEALLTLGTIRAWEALRTLAKEDASDPSASCKPFSADRSGLVLGEGAAIVVLEEWETAKARGARILGELVGYSSGSDSTHITQPSVAGQASAMRAALADAELPADAIGYINAHGTGTLLNDRTETQAIKEVFGERAYRLPVSSTKSMHGHLMGAAGAVEFVACLQALANQAVPPTQHLALPDPECDLDYVPNQGRQVADLDYTMSNSFAFGGTSAVLIAKRP
ncbi:beta-ketoacyl-[acyl-carrier-protein] synthase family protein [Azoarcus sp. DN11]|uniref:beta-ketoacyl-[acyl-carrier-protein] synthase family protein n=1 Tax=Azoarcus sp. DN11 TaxID=356837 RepID=UPI000EB441A5|nr:beta-ketoacyl-[acyl-carrier-protein] synthase family protein [Azoarcus sp. DN11]AYH43871.1 beta-ketoacyl synthase [Azoarcus sp. DN11]